MKNWIVTFLLVFVGYNAAWAYRIEGKLANIPEGTEVCLVMPSYGEEPVYIDRVSLEEGEFVMGGTAEELVCLDLCLFRDGEYSSDVRLIWIDQETEITVTGSGTDLSDWEIVSTAPEQQVTDRMGKIWNETVHDAYWQDQQQLDSALRVYVVRTLPIVEEDPDNQAAFEALTGSEYLPFVPWEKLQELFQKMSPAHQDELQELIDR